LVLFCGRLSAEKNPDGLIQAWRSLHAENPDAELAIVGEGPLKDRISELARVPELGGSVSVVGSQEDVLPWYRAADLFVLPSHHEGLSNSLIEAMSCELPIVSTRVSGSSEIISRVDVGELVDVDDMDALAKAIGRMLRDPVRRQRCGKNARALVQEEFSIEAVAAATVALYQRLLR
jgi:glycosyltransferase involved in cell wall biosynthesis